MDQVSGGLNGRASVQEKLSIERLALRPLPVARFADYEPLVARVKATGTIQVRQVTYSVPSRLIGQQLTVHVRHDRLELYRLGRCVETLPRLHPRKGAKGVETRRIDFRHVIESLRRKPRALLRARLQDDLLPGESWRDLWRQLLGALPPDEAAKVMVDALHVAAKRNDLAGVEGYLRRALRPWRKPQETVRIWLKPPPALQMASPSGLTRVCSWQPHGLQMPTAQPVTSPCCDRRLNQAAQLLRLEVLA